MKCSFAQMKSNSTVKLTPEDDEDLWNLYNLIHEGDGVSSTTFRKISLDKSNSGKNATKSVRTNICIGVEKIDYDIASKQIRLNGKVVEENEFVKIGCYHSLVIEIERPIKVKKQRWDRNDNELLSIISDQRSKASHGAIIFNEGLAHICHISNLTTQLQSKIQMNIPKNKQYSDKYTEGLDKFYSAIYTDMKKYFDFEKLKSVIIASPAFYRDQLLEYILKAAKEEKNDPILGFKSKFLLKHSTSGFIGSMNELLRDPKFQESMNDLDVLNETKLLAKLGETMAKKEHQAIYGFKHAEYCAPKQCIDNLFILDRLYRSKDLDERKRYVKIHDQAKSGGAQITIFSSMTESGKELERMGGIAGILKYPLLELDDIDF